MKRHRESYKCHKCGAPFLRWKSKGEIICEACQFVEVGGVQFVRSRTSGIVAFHDLLASESWCRRNRIKNAPVVGWAGGVKVRDWELHAVHAGDWSWWAQPDRAKAVGELMPLILACRLTRKNDKLRYILNNELVVSGKYSAWHPIKRAQLAESQLMLSAKIHNFIDNVALRPLLNCDVWAIMLAGGAARVGQSMADFAADNYGKDSGERGQWWLNLWGEGD